MNISTEPILLACAADNFFAMPLAVTVRSVLDHLNPDQGIGDQVIQFIANHTELPYPDQDALNFVLAGKWYELDPRWNQIPVAHHFNAWQDSPYTEQQLFDVVHHPFIVHYGSKPKPWDRRCTHPQKSLWYDSLNKTAWAGWEDTDFNHNTRFIRQGLRRLIRKTKQLLASSKPL